MTNPSRIALGVGALFLGGLIGGVVGAWMVSRSAPPAAPVRFADDDTAAELARVLREVADELAVLRRAQPLVVGGGKLDRPSEREPAAKSAEPVAALDEERIVAALERLTAALEAAPARGPLSGGAPIELRPPPEGSREDALLELLRRDREQVGREFLLWNYQQVLERFGKPDTINNGDWMYKRIMPDIGEDERVTFRFHDGLVGAVYR